MFGAGSQCGGRPSPPGRSPATATGSSFGVADEAARRSWRRDSRYRPWRPWAKVRLRNRHRYSTFCAKFSYASIASTMAWTGFPRIAYCVPVSAAVYRVRDSLSAWPSGTSTPCRRSVCARLRDNGLGRSAAEACRIRQDAGLIVGSVLISLAGVR